jgi:hypothetical protein
VNFYFIDLTWLWLALIILPLILSWRKVRPRSFTIGGFFNEQPQQVIAANDSGWPGWWWLLLASCILSLLALTQPHVIKTVAASELPPTPYITSAVPISATMARVQVVASDGSLSLYERPISADLSTSLAAASSPEQKYQFARVKAFLPTSAIQLNDLLLATWPLLAVETADAVHIEVDGIVVQFSKQLDFDGKLTAVDSAEIIHALRNAIQRAQPARDYSALLNSSTDYQVSNAWPAARLIALIAAACAVISLLLFRRR